MKAKIKLFMSAIMLLLFVGVFSGCTSDDDFLSTTDFGELSAEDNENIEAIKQFLEKTFPYGEDPKDLTFRNLAATYKGFEKYRGDTCLIINSSEELKSIYSGDEEIPKTDFSKISVIIGRVDHSGVLIYQFESFNIKNSKDETLITLNFKVKDGVVLAYCAQSEYYFFKIVPKFKSGKTIRAKANCPPLPWEII